MGGNLNTVGIINIIIWCWYTTTGDLFVGGDFHVLDDIFFDEITA